MYENLGRPESYSELRKWLKRNLSQRVRNHLDELARVAGPRAAAYELKKLDPDALDTWTIHELEEFLEDNL